MSFQYSSKYLSYHFYFCDSLLSFCKNPRFKHKYISFIIVLYPQYHFSIYFIKDKYPIFSMNQP